ncbi:outer membrane beta-barrel family protein [Gramella sp. KN1008]|uniref:outer membrane beta-barrel family protein n=1 Tax=Gramella sp. KN1008 TaxID=2529298 RepID=UPI00103BAF21|nr:outer membrane beta-barrel family protein [Gramella sp. KN1008]TBW25823.1 TonB-dependent receptor [Gramella sp. KN1008]
MKILKFAPLLCLLMPYFVSGQSYVQGRVVNEDNEGVAFANVILLSAQDSTTVYKGTISEENGSFNMENVEDSVYLLKISFVGYKDELRKIRVENNTDLEPIVLEVSNDALDEVTVNARRPKVSRQVDRIVFDVENTTLSTGSSFEILKRTPGVIVSQDQLLVRNRPATVYINDRKVYLTSRELQQLLEGFSAGNVKSVEVITNPPAKYDAEGGAILNIKTSKNISIGYKGSLNASNTIAIVPKYNVGTSQYYKTDWLNFFASYNFNYRNIYKEEETFVEFFSPNGETDSYWFTDFERDTRDLSHNLNTILDFNLSETSTLSFSANIQLSPKNDSDIGGLTEIYDPQNSLDSLFTTDSQLKSETDNILLSASYNTSLGSKGGSFSAVANFIDFQNDGSQDLMTRYFSSDDNLLNENSFITVSNQTSRIYTGQMDIQAPLGSINFETGLKYSGLKTDSGQEFFDTNGGTMDFSGNLSDALDYDENIYAAYAGLSRDWEKVSMKIGLRGEFTDVEGTSENLGVVNSQEYFELFPTFYLMYSSGENHSLGIDYSRRITRPRFQSLNTYRYFINEKNFQEGNPDLRPSINNKINFNYTYKNKLSFDLYWERANNAIALLPFQDNEAKTLRYLNTNMAYDQQFSLDVMYYSYLTDWWYLYTYGSVYTLQYRFTALESNAQKLTNEVTSTYLQAYNQFTLSKDGTFIGELTGSYMPGFIVGSYDYEEAQYGLSIGLRKSFFDSRLITTVNVEDIFNSMNIPLRSQYLNQNNAFFAKPESRMIRFGLTYKFGNFKLNDNKRAIDAEESERLKEIETLQE